MAGSLVRKTVAVWSLAFVTHGAVVAQSDLEAFDAAYARISTTSREAAQQRVAVTASDLFLRLDADSAGRAARLAQGLEATLRAGRTEIAADLAVGLTAGQLGTDDLVHWQLIAFVRADRPAELAAALAGAIARQQTAAVDRVLRAEERLLLPLADRALRRGDAMLGRLIFAELAALEPPQAFRYANYGLCLRNLGEVDAAERCYAQAAELAPNDAQIENDRGLLLRATGRRSEALAAFRRSYALDAADGGQLGAGPAITNLLHLEAVAPGGESGASAAQDPLPLASRALAVRPTAAMLRRLVLDVTMDRLAAPGTAPPEARDR